ncbi:MAG: S8 family serine peptidase, partial [Paraclostridium sp.]
MENSKPHLGIDKLHEEGIKGKGMKVGVIDTGIDYNHPDLKDNYKGGYDFVDNDDSPMEATPEDWKASGLPEHHPVAGSSYYTSHGTHVSGTVAGTGKNTDSEFATTGIAPEADLYAYRVLGPYGTGYTTDILAAIEKSVEDGMDVINLSLGANTNDP